MKLKFLFFPLSLAIVVTMIIWYIWPTWFDENTGIAVIQQEIAQEQLKLDSVKSKQSNLAGLISSMNANSGSNKNFTMRYYPESEKNEVIVNELDQFAKSANVVISNSAVAVIGGSRSRVSLAQSGCLAIGEAVGSARRPVARTEGALSTGITESNPDIVEVNLDLVGNYDGIKRFLTSTYGMEMLNNLSVVRVSKVIRVGEEASDELEAKLTMCFGYLPQSTVSLEGDFLEHSIFSKNSFDFSYITKLRDIITKATSDIAVGQTSKPNPFVR